MTKVINLYMFGDPLAVNDISGGSLGIRRKDVTEGSGSTEGRNEWNYIIM